jgi:hypothetical protein
MASLPFVWPRRLVDVTSFLPAHLHWTCTVFMCRLLLANHDDQTQHLRYQGNYARHFGPDPANACLQIMRFLSSPALQLIN